MRLVNPVLITHCGCHIWLGTVDSDGYGSIVVSGSRKGFTTKSTHRQAWENCYGKIPENMRVLHKCDIPTCVNVDHLFLGTQKDNVADCVTKGRHKNPAAFKKGHPYYPKKIK